MLTYAEFKRLDVYKTADVVEIFNENGIEIDDKTIDEVRHDIGIVFQNPENQIIFMLPK